jgi:hypothetical protein
MRLIRLSALAAVLGLAVLAQTDSGIRSVHGTVTDPGGEPLRGAVVKLEDTRSLQIRTYLTQRDGTYAFHRLSADIDYTLQADYKGRTSGTKRLSRFDSSKDKQLDLKVGS